MTPIPATLLGPRETSERIRVHITVHGAVQGVGFRPFVFRLAAELGLTGWICNSAQGARIQVEGGRPQLQQFIHRLETEKPPHSVIQRLETTSQAPAGDATFEIRHSDTTGEVTTLVLPDLGTCPECLEEIFDPNNRRYFYPFTNCTHCGPRFSIIEALPYDRPNTAMKQFAMCEQCQAEYANPQDRRFHAQPNACPVCGPHVELWDRTGRGLESRRPALVAAIDAVRHGAIVAVKGLGGFHLVTTARDQNAVARLRVVKHRAAKPLALMFPSLAMVATVCEVSALEERLLRSAEAPIVLLRRRSVAGGPDRPPIAPSVAPRNPRLGVMLPYTPLHHLLLASLGVPIVATSGNVAEEPICSDEHEAVKRLGGIADLFLVHDRPIVRPMDDSVVQVVMDYPQVLRRARGYAPLPVALAQPLPPTLAVGAHSKNAVAVSVGKHVFLSQHVGDLDNLRACATFRQATADLPCLYGARPTLVAADAHPDYCSTHFAHACGLPVVSVQHHYAHVLSCMAEHELDGCVLGVAWDGTGCGPDGTVWGGEFLKITPTLCQRVAHFRTFPLPNNEKAIYEPRRSALGLLHEMFGDAVFAMRHVPSLRAFTPNELGIVKTMLRHHLNEPRTSSAGRLFDAVASLLGLRQTVRFEGQAAMDLEFAVDTIETDQTYPVRGLVPDEPREVDRKDRVTIVDWAPMIEGILEDLRMQVPAWDIAAKFHNALAETVLSIARLAGEARVVLTGGCFQNRCLTEQTVKRLRAGGFDAYWHQRVPPNDGGIALGQIVAASRACRGQDRRHAAQPRTRDDSLTCDKPVLRRTKHVSPRSR